MPVGFLHCRSKITDPEFSDRVFSHASPAAWNSLPEHLCTVVDPAKFAKKTEGATF